MRCRRVEHRRRFPRRRSPHTWVGRMLMMTRYANSSSDAQVAVNKVNDAPATPKLLRRTAQSPINWSAEFANASPAMVTK